MALVVEDGSIVANANSYNSVAEIRDYATARGSSLPALDADIEKLAIQATDYLESLYKNYQGYRTSPATQTLQWPRTGVVLYDDLEIGANEIPILLKRAHAQATIEAYSQDLLPNNTQGVKKEKVDVLEVEYQDGSSDSVGLPKVDALLGPLFTPSAGFSIRTVRV